MSQGIGCCLSESGRCQYIKFVKTAHRLRLLFDVVAPLTGITAAVVGVIVNLAVFFAWHVFWPGDTFPQGADTAAMLIGAAAAIALFRYKLGVIPVIAAAAAAGAAAKLVFT